MLEGGVAGKKLNRNNFSGHNKEEIIKKLHKHVEAQN